MRIEPVFVDKYDNPPSYEDAIKYPSMPPVYYPSMQSYPTVTSQQEQQHDDAGSHFATDIPLHAQQAPSTLHRK